MKPKFLLYIGLAIGLLSACSGNDGDYDASGSFEATEIIVSAEASGKIEHLNVMEGQQLEKGQQVGLIDTTQLYLQKMNLLTNRGQCCNAKATRRYKRTDRGVGKTIGGVAIYFAKK